MKQTAAARERNMAVKRDIKLATKAFLAKPTAASLSSAQSKLDTAVKKNILPKATAARRKSALSRIAKEAGVKLAAAPAKKPATKPAATKKPAAKAAAAKKPAAKKAPAKKPAAKSTTAKKPAAKK
jgi:ribosomal protein S20